MIFFAFIRLEHSHVKRYDSDRLLLCLIIDSIRFRSGRPYMLSGCRSRVDDDASGFNKSMVRMLANGVDASLMLIVFRHTFAPLSVFIRAKSTFELTCIL